MGLLRLLIDVAVDVGYLDDVDVDDALVGCHGYLTLEYVETCGVSTFQSHAAAHHPKRGKTIIWLLRYRWLKGESYHPQH